MAAAPALFLFFCVFISSPSHSSQTSTSGFSIELIHRDSHLSPLHDPSATSTDHAKHAVRRSLYRLSHLQSSMSAKSPSAIESPVSSGNGEYFMNLWIGSPPLPLLAIMDTGSDLIWTQCLPCTNCYKQTPPIFKPANSSTYIMLTCNSPLCQAMPTAQKCHHPCSYSYKYQDDSYTKGVLAAETFTFNSSNGFAISIPNVAFGCGYDNGGNFEVTGGGVVGLGGGPLSLISQLGSRVNFKFSYFLAPLNNNSSTSQLSFGDRAVVSGKGVVSTPLTLVAGHETFYFLDLDDISVGSKKLNIPPGTFRLRPSGKGGLFIDSGTTYTYLHRLGYNMLEMGLKSEIKLPRVTDPDFNLCYAIAGNDSDRGIPSLTFHFYGADVHLSPLNTFVAVGNGTLCLAVFPGNHSILGVLAQQNFHVGFDLVGNRVSFAPAESKGSRVDWTFRSILIFEFLCCLLFAL